MNAMIETTLRDRRETLTRISRAYGLRVLTQWGGAYKFVEERDAANHEKRTGGPMSYYATDGIGRCSGLREAETWLSGWIARANAIGRGGRR